MKSLQEIADKAARAVWENCHAETYGTLELDPLGTTSHQWKTEAPARLAFAQSVMEQVKEGLKGPLCDEDSLWRWFTRGHGQSMSEVAAEVNCLYDERISGIPPLPAQEPAMPRPPPGFHLATEEERKCLPVGSLIWLKLGGSRWRPSSNIGVEAAHELHFYACPNHPQLVTFDASGKLLPPPFGEWHTVVPKDKLPDGWRPLLRGEQIQDGDALNGKRYNVDAYVVIRDDKSEIGHVPEEFPGHFYFTQRPLPAPPKEPEWVPLDANDIVPGSVFRHTGWSETDWVGVGRVRASHVWLNSDTDIPVNWQALMADWQILRPGGEWERCAKLKREGAA